MVRSVFFRLSMRAAVTGIVTLAVVVSFLGPAVADQLQQSGNVYTTSKQNCTRVSASVNHSPSAQAGAFSGVTWSKWYSAGYMIPCDNLYNVPNSRIRIKPRVIKWQNGT